MSIAGGVEALLQLFLVGGAKGVALLAELSAGLLDREAVAGLQRLPQPGLRHGAQMVATDPQYPHRPAPGGAGDGSNRIGVRSRHRVS